MKRKILSLILIAVCALAISCNNSKNSFVTISGNGTLNIEYQQPSWLYRLIVKSSPEQITAYILGAHCNIDTLGQIYGRGPAVRFIIPNSDAETTLPVVDGDVAQIPVAYSQFVDFSTSEAIEITESFIDLASGYVEVIRTGAGYRIRIIGRDAAGRDISASYLGTIYADYHSEE